MNKTTGLEEEYRELVKKIYRLLDDDEFQRAVKIASYNAQIKVHEVLLKNPSIKELAREVEEIKKKVIRNLEQYVEDVLASFKRVGIRAYYAETPSEAREYIGSIVGKEKKIVLSKSMVAEEIQLRRYLEDLGNQVWETDLGELLVQLSGTKPMHSIAPAIHLSKKSAIRVLRDKLGLVVDEDDSVEKVVALVREKLRKVFLKADVGVSGANSIAVDTGAIFIVENEGNARLVTGLPEKHIVVTGVEKIVPTTIDALKVALVQSAYAGPFPPSYINIITGPSSTADIEHKRVYGAHGPRELHVVLINNGRIEASKHSILHNQLRCIRCGRCQFECPVFRHTANYWGGPVYGGPMGINWTAITNSIESATILSLLCLGCRRCDATCPVRIPLTDIIWYLKKKYMNTIGVT